MGFHETVSAERVHIGFFGLRNAGKSSLVNAVIGQSLAVVSPIRGTTTDPVKKAMELLPLGPVVVIDTPGLDDEGELGALRVGKARQVLRQTDAAVLVAECGRALTALEQELVGLFRERELPYIIVYNKADLSDARPPLRGNELAVSALTGENVGALKELLGRLPKRSQPEKRVIADLLSPGDFTVLVTPIDEAAPKGRLILPQQQTMRDLLDAHCAFAVCQPEELRALLDSLAVRPQLIVTDSQAFGRVAKDAPADVLLTSFSILFARYKGDLETLVQGAAKLGGLRGGDRVLISEGCTHHRQCGDIGTVKLPRWIEGFCGAKPEFCFTSGGEFPDDLSAYALVVHCGGCMLNETEMRNRMRQAAAAGVPIVNYGVAIAQMHGILKRSLEPFPQLSGLL